MLSESERKELRRLGIRSLHDILDEIDSPSDAHQLAEETEVTSRRMLDLWRLAELRQVHGVGDATAQLLLEAGVRSVVDLSRRNPDNLYKALKDVNEEQKLLGISPRKRMILRWIRRARRILEFSQNKR